MIKGIIFRTTVFLIAVTIVFGACRKREGLSLADNYVTFETGEQGMTPAENSIVVKVKLSRPTDQDIPLTIDLTPLQAVYGTEFTTVPAISAATGPDAGKLKITVPSGNNEASFTVNKVPGTLYDGDEKVVFDLYRSESPVLIGTRKQFTLNFAELIASNSSYRVDGGGATYPNKVFIDLSANRQTAVLRTNWDLGFYTDANDFKVILNSSTAMMAKPINKNDLTQVTAADTAGFVPDLTYGSLVPGQMGYVDYPDGSLDKTAIGLVAATATDNKVYIVNRGLGIGSPTLPARGWKKIRVIRNANGGYTLQHADIASATFSSIDIPKDDKYFFKYISFETGIVSVEPEKTKWDITWTFSGFVFNVGGEVPYVFQDIVFQNKNVQVAKVMTTAKPYADFGEADIAGQTFSASQMAIGSDWRTTQPAAPRADRYYIIKDGNNNYYKLKFTAIMDNGIRGYPSIEYALVKKG